MNRLIVIFTLLLLHESNLESSQFIPKAFATTKLSASQLKKELTKLFNSDEAKDIHWGVSVIRLKDKSEIYSLNDTKRFRPASNMKIVIAAAALKALGTKFKFETKLFIDGKTHGKTLKGNLIALGSGDPTFHVDYFNKWIEDLKKYGIKKITGDIIGVDTTFDDQKIGILWSWNDLSNCYSAQISGLQINGNCLGIKITPGIKNLSATVEKIPNTPYVSILNNTKTTNKPSSLKFQRKPDSNRVIIKGNINIKTKEITKWVSVDNPTMYFVNLLYEALKKNKFIIMGRPRDARDIGYVLNRNKSYQVSTHKSLPLKIIINNFLKYSINLYGESILKNLGFVYFNVGTTYNGRLAVNLILKDYTLPEDVIFIADGSGLSKLNLISPQYMALLLSSISKSPFYKTFFDALSISGMSGTLRKKLNSHYLKGAIHAKTGYIRNVRALSGYIDTFGKERLAFAIFANNYGKKMQRAETIINNACSLMRKLEK